MYWTISPRVWVCVFISCWGWTRPTPLDAVAYLAPHTTVNVICGGKAAEKQALRLPEKLVNMVHCPNPACISNHEQVDDVFTLVDPDKGTYRCLYCETAAK